MDMQALPSPSSLLPYVESTFHFQNKKLKKFFPDGFHFRFGLGTTAVATILSTIAALLILDQAGIVDAEELATKVRDTMGAFGAGEEKEGAGLKWYEIVAPVTMIGRFL